MIDMDMTCDVFRKAHPADSAAARAHAAACPDCAAFARAWELLRAYPAIAPSASFFSDIRRKRAPSILRFAAPLTAAAAGLLIAVALSLNAPPATDPGTLDGITDEERELVENLDLLQNYELARSLEFVGDTGFPPAEEDE